jgi:hypothetical protein
LIILISIYGSIFPQTTEIESLKIREINLKGCIQTIFKKQFVITTESDYLKTVRNDASRDYCLKNIEKIDFEKEALLGININSGYCRRPTGLNFQILKDLNAKEYQFNISYTDPKGSVCRALSQYDLWVLIPKLIESYTVKFNVEQKNIPDENLNTFRRRKFSIIPQL